MTTDEVRDIVEGGESAQVEFKRSTGQRTAAAKAICGMLNGQGGYVLFGVKDDGTIVGQEVADSTRQDVARELGKIEPQVVLDPDVVPVEGSALSSSSACRETAGGRMPTTGAPTFAKVPRRARWSSLPTRPVSLRTAIPGGAGKPARPRAWP